jgi:hypothetical protein
MGVNRVGLYLRRGVGGCSRVFSAKYQIMIPNWARSRDCSRRSRGKAGWQLFTLGDENAVLARSRALILDPLLGDAEPSRNVTCLNPLGTIKELAQLDGGFVISRGAIVLSARRHFDAVAAPVDVPLGLGSRHIAAASMGAVTKVLPGQLVGEIIPEVWRMDYASHLPGAAQQGTSRRAHDSDTKSPTGLDREWPWLTTDI